MLAQWMDRLPIRLRLALTYTVFLVVTVAAVGTFLLATLATNLRQEMDEALQLRASQVARATAIGPDGGLEPEGAAAALADLAPMEEFSAPGIYVQVLGHTGSVLASSRNLPGGQLPVMPDLIAGALRGREGYADVPAGGDQVRVLAQPVRSGENVAGVVLVGESQHVMAVTLRRVQQILGVAIIGASVVSLIGGWWLTARALGPVSDLTRVARHIAGTGQFDQRIATRAAQDELGELAATINEMLARLEGTFRRQREFLADASHELRGPLTVIRGNLELLQLELADEERRQSALEAVAEVDRMGRLVSDLLFLAEVDAQEMVGHEPVDLRRVVADVWQQARAVDGGSHEIVLAHDDPTTLLGDPDRLRQMLWNLVENALRYTPPGGRVSISLRRQGQIAELAVADTGPGIAAEHLPRIFDRFYRVDRARSRAQGGSGLGLAIVKQVAEAHGGQVRVRSEPDEGSTFTVALPVA